MIPPRWAEHSGADKRDWEYIVKKRKYDEDAKHLVTTELRESRGMTEMLGAISTSVEPGVLVRPTV